jgi:hypothetical protein
VRVNPHLYRVADWPYDRISRFRSFIATGAADACWPWEGSRTPRGIGRFRWSERRRAFSVYAPRVVYILAHGSVPRGREVLHECGFLSCCNPRHLIAGKPPDRLRLVVAHGRSIAGMRHPGRKLGAKDVRRLIATKRKHPYLTSAELAKTFGLASPSVVSAILSGRAWRSLDVPRLKLAKGPVPNRKR